MLACSNALALLAADGRSDGRHLTADTSAYMQPIKKAPPLPIHAFIRANCEDIQRIMMESLFKYASSVISVCASLSDHYVTVIAKMNAKVDAFICSKKQTNKEEFLLVSRIEKRKEFVMMMHCRTRCNTSENMRQGCVWLVYCSLILLDICQDFYFIFLTRH